MALPLAAAAAARMGGGGLASGAAANIGTGFDAFKKPSTDNIQAFATLADKINESSASAKKLTKETQSVTQAFTGAALKVAGTVAAIAGLVQIANPAAFEMFTLAFQDMLGVVGRMLTPVLEGLTVVFRTLGDILETLRPAIMPITNLMGTVLKLFAKVAETVMLLLMPAIEMVIPLIEALADAFTAAAEVINGALSLIGGGNKLKSSIGAAARPTMYSSIEDVGRRSSLAAFGVGSAGDPKLDEAKKTNLKLDKISIKLDEIIIGAIPGVGKVYKSAKKLWNELF